MMDPAWQLIDSVADGTFTVDTQLIIRQLSPGMERLLGIRAADAVGLTCALVLRGSRCGTDCPLRTTLARSAQVQRCTEDIHRADVEEPVPVSITTALLHNEQGVVTGLVGVVRDNTEVERLRREISEYRRQQVFPPPGPGESTSQETPAEHLRRVLEEHRWNASRAARSMGVSRTTLWRRMKEYGLQIRRETERGPELEKQESPVRQP